MTRFGPWRVAILLGLVGCGSSITSIPDPNADLVVRVPESVYRWDDVELNQGLDLGVVLENTGSRTYFARLGDAFNTSDDQPTLFVAEGSDAFLERAEPSGWMPVERAILIEGVKFVQLSAGSTYDLLTYFPNGRITGTFRLRVRFSENESGDPAAGEVVSQAFEIR